MPSWDPTVAGNTRSQQRQLDKIGTARMGPVSIGPGDGHIRYYDASGLTTFRTDGAGAQVYAHGALRPLGSTIESKASQTYVDGNIATLVAKDSAQDGRMDGIDSDLATKAAISYVDTVDAKANAAQSRADAAHRNAGTAHARADAAYSRAGTGISNAATAQSRADSAYSRAGTGISNAATAQNRADAAHSRASQILSCLRGINTSSSRSIAPMSEPDPWQALRNCLSGA